MAAIWRLVHACIIPILTYGAETWNPTKAELLQTQKILNNTLRRIIKAPISTPTEILTAETGVWDVETQMDKKQVLYYHKLRNEKDKTSTLAMLTNDPKNPWLKRVEKTIQKTEISKRELLSKNSKQAKIYVNDKMRTYQVNKIFLAAEKKSKVRDYVCMKTRTSLMKRTPYMDHQKRENCTNIFNTRARMLNVKCNYKNKYADLTCRWCRKATETQLHIMHECEEFKHLTKNTPYELYFSDRKNAMETPEMLLRLRRIINKINDINE